MFFKNSQPQHLPVDLTRKRNHLPSWFPFIWIFCPRELWAPEAGNEGGPGHRHLEGMTIEKTFTRKTVNRLRAAQDDVLELQKLVTAQAAKWLQTPEKTLEVPLPLQFTDGDSGTSIRVLQHVDGNTKHHQMPVDYLFASDDVLLQDYLKYQELMSRFAAAETAAAGEADVAN